MKALKRLNTLPEKPVFTITASPFFTSESKFIEYKVLN